MDTNAFFLGLLAPLLYPASEALGPMIALGFCGPSVGLEPRQGQHLL